MSRPAHNGTINTYRCPKCGVEWQDEWDSEVEDDCPTCGTTCTPGESSPVSSCDSPECQKHPIETPRAIKLVMEVHALSEGADGYPIWAEVLVTPQLLARIRHLRDLCQRERLSWVYEQTGLDRWESGQEYRIAGEAMAVGPDRFYFVAYPKHADFEVETAGVDEDCLFAVMDDPTAKIPEHWALRGNVLYIAVGDSSLEYLIESYESEGSSGGAGS